jgi:hypothetical protein
MQIARKENNNIFDALNLNYPYQTKPNLAWPNLTVACMQYKFRGDLRGGSRDRISWDRNRRSKLLVFKIDHEIEIIEKCHEIEINIFQNDQEIELALGALS